MTNERWKPEAGNQYWLIDFGFSKKIRPTIWDNDRIDNLTYACGNCFRTEEEAEAAAEKVKALLLSLHDTTQVTTQVTTPFEELPDWCKIGTWVYSYDEKDYAKVKSLCTIGVNLIFVKGNKHFQKSFKYINNECVQARLRPYNADEMKALVGKVLDTPAGAYCIYAYDIHTDNVETAYAFYNAQDFLDCKYSINNAPCGVLEHLNENGEWVE